MANDALSKRKSCKHGEETLRTTNSRNVKAHTFFNTLIPNMVMKFQNVDIFLNFG